MGVESDKGCVREGYDWGVKVSWWRDRGRLGGLEVSGWFISSSSLCKMRHGVRG